MRHTLILSDSDFALYESALSAAQPPFVINVGGGIAGGTRSGDIRAAHSGLEIGWTRLAEKGHGTGVNLRMKRLLLRLDGTLRDAVMSSVLREEWE